MKTPEVFEIKWDKIMRTSVMHYKEYIFRFLNRPCLCNHYAFRHEANITKQLDSMSDRVCFGKCQTTYCHCDMFKQDNLKYLEQQADGR